MISKGYQGFGPVKLYHCIKVPTSADRVEFLLITCLPCRFIRLLQQSSLFFPRDEKVPVANALPRYRTELRPPPTPIQH